MEEGSSSRSNKRPALEVPFDPPRRYLTLQEIIQHSPSGKDGMEWKTEVKERMKCGNFLRRLCTALKLPQSVIERAGYYLQQFFLLKSLAYFRYETIGTACVYIACRVERIPCTRRDAVVFSYGVLHWPNCEEARKRIKESQEIYKERVELIILAETLVCSLINTHVKIQTPHDFITTNKMKFAREPSEELDKFVQMACRIASEGILTTLCLQFSPLQIAGACIFFQFKLKNQQHKCGNEIFWQNTFDVTQQQLEVMYNQLLEVFQTFYGKIPLEGNAGDGGGASADAQAPATNEAQVRTSGAGTSGAGDGDGDDDEAIVAAETLLMLKRDTNWVPLVKHK